MFTRNSKMLKITWPGILFEFCYVPWTDISMFFSGSRKFMNLKNPGELVWKKPEHTSSHSFKIILVNNLTKKQLKSCFFVQNAIMIKSSDVRENYFSLFFPQSLLKENQKYEQKLWPKNQDVNPYSQEMCAGTNKHVIVWENKPHMCTGFFTPSRSTWPLDVESTPQAIVSLMRVCDSESSKRCDWWQWLHRVLNSCDIWITWISSQNNLSKYRQRQQTGSSETKVRSKNWSKNNRVKIQTLLYL